MIQITAPISPGSSGSPVLDESGYVIGIATQVFKEGQNLNFAISAEAVQGAIAQSLHQTTPNVAMGSAKEYLTRGFNKGGDGDLEGAITDLTEAIRIQPDYIDAFVIRGNFYYMSKEYRKAISDCTEAIRLLSLGDPTSKIVEVQGGAYGRRADAYFGLKQ
jgi:S1-C subfamily serine protease